MASENRRALAHHGRIDADRLRHLGQLLLAMRQEFMQRRVEQADGHRQPDHDAEERDEIVSLEGHQLLERDASPRLVARHDHLTHGADAGRRGIDRIDTLQ